MKLSEIAKTPEARTPAGLAYEQAEKIGRRFPAGEALIAKSPYFSLLYAQEILRKRFPLGEKTIATSALHSSQYASEVLKGRFPAGEPAIKADKYYLKRYKSFLKSIGSKLTP